METNKIYLESCLETMRRMPDGFVDFICTDPPYELDNHGGGQTDFAQRKLVKDLHIDFISAGFDFKILDECCRVLKKINIALFCSNKQISKLMAYFEALNVSTTLLVWKKTNPIPFGNGKFLSDIEFIIYAKEKGCPFNQNGNVSKVFALASPRGKNRIHPTQKPLELVSNFISLFSNENDLVYDPFIGSGTTAKAAHLLKRNWIGSEISAEYVELANEWLKPCLNQTTLF